MRINKYRRARKEFCRRLGINMKITKKGIFWKSNLSHLIFDIRKVTERVYPIFFGKGPDFRWFRFLGFDLCIHGNWKEKA